MTLGRIVIAGNEDDSSQAFVKSFSVSYSLDGVKWFKITDALSLTEVNFFMLHYYDFIIISKDVFYIYISNKIIC